MNGTKLYNFLRKAIRKELIKINENSESGYYPIGAEFDPNAPWNKDVPDSPTITYDIDYANQQFHVTSDNGNNYDVDFVDVLNSYWKDTPGSFEKHYSMFGSNEETMDIEAIKLLRNENFNFEKILYKIGEKNEKL